MTTTNGWSRRRFLRAAGTAIALPFFPSLYPRAAWAGEGDPADVPPPTRLMFFAVPLGFVPTAADDLEQGPSAANAANKALSYSGKTTGWFPQKDGSDYELPGIHAALTPYREHLSFLKGLSNPRYRGEAHAGDEALLTCHDTMSNPARFTNAISCDQLAAELGGKDVRYPCLVLGCSRKSFGSHRLSWTRQGVPISPITSPIQLFDDLFGKDDVPIDVRLQRLKEKRSVMDATLGEAKDLARELNADDQRKLDEVTTAVREVEEEIQREEHWVNLPKPKPPCERPETAAAADDLGTRHLQAMLALIHAAFVTDSTRVVSYALPDVLSEVTRFDKHSLNHPAGDEQKSKDAGRLDAANSEQLAYLAKLLCDGKERDGQPLMHHCAAFYGASIWGENHQVRNLPAMLLGEGGGRIRQGATRTYAKATPIANLWLTMLTSAGLAVDRFGDSTGVLEGLMA